MPRSRKKKNYTVKAVVRQNITPYTIVFTQKAWEVNRAFMLAHRTLVRNGLWIKSIDVFYPGRETREIKIELIRQNHVRRTNGFVWFGAQMKKVIVIKNGRFAGVKTVNKSAQQ